MAKTISNLSVLQKIYSVADALEVCIHRLHAGSIMPRPGNTYRQYSQRLDREAGHSAIRMFIESFEWQRERSEKVVRELKELDEMLDACDEDFSDNILRQFAGAWYDFNSESRAKSHTLLFFLRETLPASIYWHLEDINKEQLLEMLQASDDD